MSQTMRQSIETALRFGIRLWLIWIGVHDQIQAAFQIIEHGELFAQHQQNIGCPEFVFLVIAGSKPRLDIGNAFKTEIAHQTTRERGQCGNFRHAKTFTQCIDFLERIFQMYRVDVFAVFVDLHVVAIQTEYAFCW